MSPADGGMGKVEVSPVSLDDPRAKEEFIRFPWQVYPKDSPWCPPLFMDRRDFLNPKKNPFFSEAEVQLFVARRGGELVGRVSACEDRAGNRFHGTKQVNFGFFECVDDEEVAAALLSQVEEWGRARGLTEMQGPMSFNTNHEVGLLVDGFEHPPSIQMTYNLPYYQGLLEKFGLEKRKDLYSWWMDVHGDPNDLPRVEKIAERVRAKSGLTFRTVNMKKWDEEVDRVLAIYNDAWDHNWGFTPFTEAEFRHTAKDLKMVVRPELAMVAEDGDVPVAFSLTIVNANQALRHANGRLFPFGLFQLLWNLPKVDTLRLIALGIRHGYRKRGIDSVFYLDSLRNARASGKFRAGEIGWTLEDNDLINRAIEMMGGRRIATYRVYGKGL